MKGFFEKYESFICKLWNLLYEYVCKWTGAEVNEDYYIDTLFPNK